MLCSSVNFSFFSARKQLVCCKTERCSGVSIPHKILQLSFPWTAQPNSMISFSNASSCASMVAGSMLI